MLRLPCVDLVPSNSIIFPDMCFPWGISGCVKLQLLHWSFEGFFLLSWENSPVIEHRRLWKADWCLLCSVHLLEAPGGHLEKGINFCQAQKETRLRQNWQLLFLQPSFVIMLWWTTSRGKYLVVMWIEILFICTGTECFQLPEYTARWIRPVV